jgi:hypothetical protein
MREQHPSIDDKVDPAAPVWRYFDLPKFISFLDRRALWFCRADLLGDPLEGSFTRAREVERQKWLANPPEGQTRKELEAVFAHNASIYAKMVRCAYINCWHLGNHESMAMWHGYGGGNFGVAVRSTFGTLSDLLPASFGSLPMGTIYVGRVKYIDYLSETEQIPEQYNVFSPFTCKSVAYQHESEVRALFVDMTAQYQQTAAAGHFIDVDLTKLIHRVTVSPLSPAWFEETIRSLCEKYGFTFHIGRSIVFSEPVY